MAGDQKVGELLVECPACAAPVGKPCNVPARDGRRDVGWFHLRREELATQKLLEYMVDFTDGGGEAQTEFFESKDAALERAQETEGKLYEVLLMEDFSVERS